MTKQILMLPVGGSASRMLGLPKFMLPVSDDETLIEKHCAGAIAAGFDEVHIITRAKYFGLISDYLEDREIKVNLHALPVETITMSETLKLGSGFIPEIEKCSVTIGLADTAFLGASYESIYRNMIEDASTHTLGLFLIREDQFGKLGQVEVSATGRVLSMQDKTVGCPFPAIWGIAKIPGLMLTDLNILDPHIGIGLEKIVAKGQFVSGVMNEAQYYDCGTFAEYSKYLTQKSNHLPQ